MKSIDRIKSLLALILILVVLVPFTVLGKDHAFTRIAAVSAIILWLILMLVVNYLKKKGNNQNEP